MAMKGQRIARAVVTCWFYIMPYKNTLKELPETHCLHIFSGWLKQNINVNKCVLGNPLYVFLDVMLLITKDVTSTDATLVQDLRRPQSQITPNPLTAARETQPQVTS